MKNPGDSKRGTHREQEAMKEGIYIYKKEIERNNSNKDLFQKHAHNRTTSGLQRDIQALKNMKKQADDVV